MKTKTMMQTPNVPSTQKNHRFYTYFCKLANINFIMSDFVIEKHGKINKDYTLLDPPIGKGFIKPIRT